MAAHKEPKAVERADGPLDKIKNDEPENAIPFAPSMTLRSPTLEESSPVLKTLKKTMEKSPSYSLSSSPRSISVILDNSTGSSHKSSIVSKHLSKAQNEATPNDNSRHSSATLSQHTLSQSFSSDDNEQLSEGPLASSSETSPTFSHSIASRVRINRYSSHR